MLNRDSTRIVVGLIVFWIALSGCSQKKEAPPAPPEKAAASAPAPKAGEKLYVEVTGRIGEDLGKPALVFANRGDKAIASFELGVYAYDAGGKQLSVPNRVTKTPVRPIRPGEIREIEMDLGHVPAGATVEVVVTHLVFVDRSEWRDDGAAPEQRAKGG